jgi:hypothetical protein
MREGHTMSGAKHPDWLQDPQKRKEWIRRLAEQGVSRAVMREAFCFSNNQMAGAANRAGVVFQNYTPAKISNMRTALKRAGFADAVIERSLCTQSRHKQKNVHVESCDVLSVPVVSPASTTTEVTQNSRVHTEEVVPQKHFVPPGKMPFAALITEEEVRKRSEQDMIAAARAIEKEECATLPLSAKSPEVRAKVVLSNKDQTLCQWPKASGGGVKIPAICAARATDGLCETHRALARRHRRL